jgi:Rps23 Pro-64 3,4-dihydroxylase Tpa1-like proline 4-hydroxylase
MREPSLSRQHSLKTHVFTIDFHLNGLYSNRHMINEQIIDKAPDIRHAFQSALPFRHVQIDNFLDPEICEGLLRDFPSFDKKKAINELGHVGGKAVIENVKSISPLYSSIYDFINSKSFLDTMSDLTGVRNLIADETLFGGGTHENLDGQYLDAHIDFNIDERRMLHRRLNLLIYLNKEWQESWGGCIELHSNPRNPETDEVKSFLPLFNRAVIFETNEYSWHGFPVIRLPQEKKQLSRKSFSIYLYTKDRPAEEVVAPHTTFYVARPFPSHVKSGEVLQESDYQYLRGLLANRDGLIQMYQELLIQKEERLRQFMQAKQ